MESPDLNSATPESAALERLLRVPTPPLPDLGFSSRVLAKLPPARRHFLLRKTIVCAAGAAAGLAYASLHGVTLAEWKSVPQQTLGLLFSVIPRFVEPRFTLAVMVSALSLVFAFRNELRSSLLS